MTIIPRALKFRAQTLEFEAVRFDGSNAEDVIEWVGPDLCDPVCRNRRFYPFAFGDHTGGHKARRHGRLDHQGGLGVFYR